MNSWPSVQNAPGGNWPGGKNRGAAGGGGGGGPTWSGFAWGARGETGARAGAGAGRKGEEGGGAGGGVGAGGKGEEGGGAGGGGSGPAGWGEPRITSPPGAGPWAAAKPPPRTMAPVSTANISPGFLPAMTCLLYPPDLRPAAGRKEIVARANGVKTKKRSRHTAQKDFAHSLCSRASLAATLILFQGGRFVDRPDFSAVRPEPD